MKFPRCMIIFLLVFCLTIPLLAQTNRNKDENRSPSGISKDQESEYYYYNIQLERIYSHNKGYVVVYRKGVNQITRALIPFSWFTGPDGKADLIQIGSGTLWPYLSVYYKNGEFSHLRMYVRKERGHITWGIVPSGQNLDKYFEDTTEFTPEF